MVTAIILIRMSITKKILIYFSLSAIVLLGAALFFVYMIFSEYREEEFQQRQKEKISTTLKLLSEFSAANEVVLSAIDKSSINLLYDEKLLIFNSEKKLIYSSIDDTPIPYSSDLLNELTPKKSWIERKDGLYDVVAMYIETNEKTYFGINKALDTFGYTKLDYLRRTLLITFLVITIIIVAISYYQAKRITGPILKLIAKINDYNIDHDYRAIETAGNTNDEIGLLLSRYNELMEKVQNAYAFQKHATHLISHELKTPLSVLLSNLEGIQGKMTDPQLRTQLETQLEGITHLSQMIDAILTVAKNAAGNKTGTNAIRIDEVIFDIAEELQFVHDQFRFAINYTSNTTDTGEYTISGSYPVVKTAFHNLMLNAIRHSRQETATIDISTANRRLTVSITNAGPVIPEPERAELFQYFYRGTNSSDRQGFGLGLALSAQIIHQLGGSLQYSVVANQLNRFTVVLPLS